MDRRNFIRVLAGNALASPLGAWAAAPRKAPRAKATSAAPLSTLAANTARDLGPYANPDFAFGPNITDYSGIALDAAGKRLCLFGGGHGPSQETDIRVFDLASRTWSSLYAPTPPGEMVFANCDPALGRYISTNQPTARHSYNLTMVRGRRFYMMCYRGMPDHLDGVLGSESGWGGRICWYDFDAKAWSYSRIPQAEIPWYFASAAALDPVSGRIVVVGPNPQAGNGGVWVYDPETDSISTAIRDVSVGFSPELVYWPRDDRFYVLQSAGRVWRIDFNRASPMLSSITEVATSGSPPSSDMGVVCGYACDPANGIIGGNVVNGLFHAFDPARATWTARAMDVEAGSAGVPGQAFHCLEFDPDSGCFVFLDTPGATAATWAYRYGASTKARSGVGDLGIALDLGGGAVAAFSGADAVDKGDFVGEFVRQKCYLATNPAFPDWRVWFRVDADASGQRIEEPNAGWRDEIVVEYGRSTAGVPAHRTAPYTATISKGGAVIATYTVPKHWWYARWRHQSLARPVVRDAATLKRRGWIPNFGVEGMYGGGPSAVDVGWPGPMGVPARPAPTFPFQPAMATGGDHEEIGFLTEHAASYAIFGGAAALNTLRTEGEWSGNWCIHIRDDATGAMPSFRDTTSFTKSNGGAINDAPRSDVAADPGFVAFDLAHYYPCANMPWLLTDDPFFLEELQFGINVRILADRAPRIEQKLGGLMYPGETRSFAWGLRDLSLAAATTPANVPSWLQPRSYWKACLDDNKAFALKFVNSPARVHAMFREWTRSDACRSWMAAWLTAVVGMAIDQGHADWAPIFRWSVQKQIQMSNGTSGWSRQWPAPYGSTPLKQPGIYGTFVHYPFADTSIDASTCASWAEYWAFYCSGTNGKSDDTGHTIDPTGWDGRTLMAQFYPEAGYSSYFLHLRAALAVAVSRAIPGARACYDYLQGELSDVMPRHYRVPGQARFAVDPRKPTYEGLWWNAPPGSESGWGLAFAHQADVIFATWFTYDASGAPSWLTMSASRSAENVYAGTLYRTSGPPFSAARFDPASVAATAVGSGTLEFADADNGTFSFAVGAVTQSKPITRTVFAPTLPLCTMQDASSLGAANNFQGLWWAAPAGSESGWGLHLAHQADTLVATWFTYGDDGAPLWLTMSAPRAGPRVYSGALYRTSGPAFGAPTFDPASVRASEVGSATIAFADGDDAMFAYTVGTVSRSTAITRLVYGAPVSVCAA
jgi:hypothetical protein